MIVGGLIATTLLYAEPAVAALILVLLAASYAVRTAGAGATAAGETGAAGVVYANAQTDQGGAAVDGQTGPPAVAWQAGRMRR